MVLSERSCHKKYTCNMRSPTCNGWKVMVKVKVFVNEINANADARTMTYSPVICPGLLKSVVLCWCLARHIQNPY